LIALLIWMACKREWVVPKVPAVSAEQVAKAASVLPKRFRRIGVAVEAKPTDAAMLAEAVALAKMHKAELILIHVVEGAGSQWHGAQTGDMESRDDASYLEGLASQLRGELRAEDVPAVDTVLGYGDVPKEIVSLSRQKGIDLLVLGGHGHKGPWDWLHGQTIPAVRHGLEIPIFAVRESPPRGVPQGGELGGGERRG
jgi:manganese transport protein